MGTKGGAISDLFRVAFLRVLHRVSMARMIWMCKIERERGREVEEDRALAALVMGVLCNCTLLVVVVGLSGAVAADIKIM